MKHHNLKSFAPRFQALWDGRMVGETRDNTDRNFQESDSVTLVEGHQNENVFEKTGRTISAIISYVDTFAVPKGYVTLSYKNIGLLIVDNK